MKKIRSIFISASLMLLTATSLTLSSCEKEVVPSTGNSKFMLPGKHHRILTLTDGANTATFEIASNNAAQLDSFAAAAQLEALYNLPNSTESPAPSPITDKTGGSAKWMQNDLHLRLISKETEPGIRGLSLRFGSIAQDEAGKVETWSSGTFSGTTVFHSYSAPHTFHFYHISNTARLTGFRSNDGQNNWIPEWGWVTNAGYDYGFSNPNNGIDYAVKVESTQYRMVWDI